MNYQPIGEDRKQDFIDWVKNLSMDLEGQPEDPSVKNIFPGSENGDIATIKDLVGNFLATLTNNQIEIK